MDLGLRLKWLRREVIKVVSWKAYEIEYLEESWGAVKIPTIAEKLERSINAVKIKAYKIGLGRHIHGGELITFNQLLKAIGKSSGYSHALETWQKLGLRIQYKASVKQKFAMVDIKHFWKWAENNQKYLDFNRFEKGALGEEPEWVKDARKADCAAGDLKKHNRVWTKADDNLLQSLLKLNYGYFDISQRLRRTEGAVKRRLLDLGIKLRPVKADNHNPWQDSEVKLLVEMHQKGYVPEVIAQNVGRSATAVRGKLERMAKQKGA